MMPRDIENALESAAKRLNEVHLAELMYQPDRTDFIFQFEDLELDCTRQPLDAASLSLLLELAEKRGLARFMDAMFAGEAINLSENRPVVHCDLRAPTRLKSDEFKTLCAFAEKVRGDKDITAVVNLGIGGSDLGPAMVVQALAGEHDGPACHFVGNVCPTDLHDALAQCDAHKTLFIVTSKTFTTAETLVNAGIARAWLESAGVLPADAMVAVTAYESRARDWGIERVFAFDEGVGGRYSLWSAVGLAVMIAIGSKKFAKMLAGAHAMDCHVKSTDYAQNLAVIMGLLRVWHRSYLGATSYGLMPYGQRLARFPAWAQQLEMESNGKGVDRHGKPLPRPAAPLIWGEVATSCQHSFFQWLHQGVETAPIDILIPRQPAEGLDDWGADWQASHRTLALNAVAQAEALALGDADSDNPHRYFPGNRASVLLSWDQTTPYALGRLLALYEHITIISGFIWGVNSFDQWGVELGKKMVSSLQLGQGLDAFSPAARTFLKRFNKI